MIAIGLTVLESYLAMAGRAVIQHTDALIGLFVVLVVGLGIQRFRAKVDRPKSSARSTSLKRRMERD